MGRSARCALALCLALGGARVSLPAWAAPALPPPLPAEHLTIETLPARSPHWVFVVDYAFNNEIDARVHLFDGDSYRELGQIDGGFNPGVNLSPDSGTSVVVTTYFARGSHGTRTDVVEFTDNTTLATTHEIVLPPKSAAGGADPVQRRLQLRRALPVRRLPDTRGLLRRARSRPRHRARRDRHRGLRAGRSRAARTAYRPCARAGACSR